MYIYTLAALALTLTPYRYSSLDTFGIGSYMYLIT